MFGVVPAVKGAGPGLAKSKERRGKRGRKVAKRVEAQRRRSAVRRVEEHDGGVKSGEAGAADDARQNRGEPGLHKRNRWRYQIKCAISRFCRAFAIPYVFHLQKILPVLFNTADAVLQQPCYVYLFCTHFYLAVRTLH